MDILNQLPADYQSRLLQWVMPILAQRWVEGVRRAITIIRRQLSREVHEGVFEVLEYDSTLVLHDCRGEAATLERREKVRFLQDGIIAYEDQAWGDGVIFAGYECSPGIPVDCYRDGAIWKVLISLRETRQRGDVVEFRFKREIRDGLTDTEEWWQTQVSHRTRRLHMAIVFPTGRPCLQALLVERNRNRKTTLGPAHFSHLSDGRQVLSWETGAPVINELYTLKWRW